MKSEHKFLTAKVKVGARGQITIPKAIRHEDKIRARDTLKVTHHPGGEIVLKKIESESPEERMLAILKRTPKIDAEKAWREIVREREMER
ncbi:MAG: hypothetical protein HYW25_05730 [Candidatus Aenigmarchaeota archaeon]|nr:hypothetical protein [Candidatus Aenigmarchaeota archaeon]